MKYRLMSATNKYTGNRENLVILQDKGKTVEVISELGQPERYKEYARRARLNARKRSFNEVLRELSGTSARSARLDMGL